MLHVCGLAAARRENPGTNGGRPVDKANYVTLLQELRTAFTAEAKLTGKPRLLLSAALAVGADVIAQSYDVKGINTNLDLCALTYLPHPRNRDHTFFLRTNQSAANRCHTRASMSIVLWRAHSR